ncbi:phosphopantetheine-binding protein [Methylobacillus gramineus]|uniref:phosphopantetheine-binding protein n=1 Tax=Methylobacillus gramineus TaxID=755169 RepID=UPI001CFFE5CB|nr:phosphopantetheine-binding protein [Methylobacillus gramineus]MCB5183737.1 phosphopantetheine-binding protein [Methylobacillus gramineus]
MEALRLEIKQLIIKSLDLEDITADDIEDDAPLFESSGLGLDSIDALELGVALRKQYNLTIEANNTNNRQHFQSVSSLAAFVEQQKN